MKLICVETGDEFESFDTVSCHHIQPTGRKFEKREGFTQSIEEKVLHISSWQIKLDTHRAICFLEPMEKEEPKAKPTLEGLESRIKNLEAQLSSLYFEKLQGGIA